MIPKYKIEQLLNININNSKEIGLNDICETIFYYDDADNLLKEVFGTLTEKRLISLTNTYLKFLSKKKHIIKEALKQDDEYSDIENKILSSIVRNNIFYSSSSEDSENRIKFILPYLGIMYFDLLYNSLAMNLPLNDDNISHNRKQIKRDILKISKTLNRMNKQELVAELHSAMDNKIHTFGTYYKDWEYEKIKYLMNDIPKVILLGKASTKKILLIIKNLVKKELETILKNIDKEHNNVITKDKLLYRLSLTAQNILLSQKVKDSQIKLDSLKNN